MVHRADERDGGLGLEDVERPSSPLAGHRVAHQQSDLVVATAVAQSRAQIDFLVVVEADSKLAVAGEPDPRARGAKRRGV
mgnify:CR=1 FL=1